MTILGLIPVTNKKNQEIELIGKVKQLLVSLNLNKLTFRVCGCSSNDKVASVQCYPTSFSVLDLRTRLRDNLGIKGKSYIEYLNVFERICWINSVRYTHIPSETFERNLKQSFEIDFEIHDF